MFTSYFPLVGAQALRVSLEEQHQRQEEEERRVQEQSLEQMQVTQGRQSKFSSTWMNSNFQYVGLLIGGADMSDVVELWL